NAAPHHRSAQRRIARHSRIARYQAMAGGYRRARRAVLARGAAAAGRNRDRALYQDRGGQRHQRRVAPATASPEDKMKLMYFDDYKLGVVTGDAVVDVSSVVQDIPHTGPHDLINGVIARFGEYRPRLGEAGRGG